MSYEGRIENPTENKNNEPGRPPEALSEVIEGAKENLAKQNPEQLPDDIEQSPENTPEQQKVSARVLKENIGDLAQDVEQEMETNPNETKKKSAWRTKAISATIGVAMAAGTAMHTEKANATDWKDVVNAGGVLIETMQTGNDQRYELKQIEVKHYEREAQINSRYSDDTNLRRLKLEENTLRTQRDVSRVNERYSQKKRNDIKRLINIFD